MDQLELLLSLEGSIWPNKHFVFLTGDYMLYI